jgi:murein DD-endopeptidase MepM/ murein hydrolase activator NlpD
MLNLNINLPSKKRLHVSFVVRRDTTPDDPIFPKLAEVKRAKKGSKLSRYFRHIFEHKKIRRLLGTNIAFAILATTLIPSPTGSIDVQAQQVVTAESPIILPTQSEAKFPVEKVAITQGYKLFHPGLDLDGITGDPIRPIIEGEVEAVDHSKYAYGNAIYVNHGNGLTSLYAHLSKTLVKIGDKVDQTTVIGLMGATGHAFGDHLHLEVRKNGVPINPLSILPH